MYKLFTALTLVCFAPCSAFAQAPLIDINSVFKVNTYVATNGSSDYFFNGWGTGTVIKTVPILPYVNKVYILACAHVVDCDEFIEKSKFSIINQTFLKETECFLEYIDYKYDIAILTCMMPAVVMAIEVESDSYVTKEGDDLQYIGFGDDNNISTGPGPRNPHIVCGKALMLTTHIKTYIDKCGVVGDSGAVLFNTNGKIVGIMRAIAIPNENNDINDGFPIMAYNQKVINKYLKSLK